MPIRRLIRKRDKLAVKAHKSRQPEDCSKYRKLRNLVTKRLKDSYRSRLLNVIGNLKDDPKPFYRFIKSRKTEPTGIQSLKTPLGTATSDVDKADCLNNFFSSVFTREDHNSYPALGNSHQQMDDFVITERGVLKLLQSLDVKKSIGPDEISPRVLKETAVEIAPVLTSIFNQSIIVDWGSP